MHPLLLYRGEAFDPNFYYYAGMDIDHAFLLLENGKKTLIVPRLNEKLAKERFNGDVVVYEGSVLETLKPLLKNKAVGIDGTTITLRLAARLKTMCKLRDESDFFARARTTKRKDEVSKIARAVSITKKIFNSIDFSKMKTEVDIKKYLLIETLKHGCEPAFEPIVATDRNARFPHYRSGDVKLGEMVLIDYGVRYKQYCADLTRCFFLKNTKKNTERKRIYNQLIKMTRSIVSNMPKLKTGKGVALYSAQLIKQFSLPEMIHSIGHGIGLEVHEAPRLGKKSTDPINGATVAIEPAVYFDDYGLRYEETVYFDGKNAKIL